MKIKQLVTGVCFSNQQDCHWTAHNRTTTKRKTADSTGVRIINNHLFLCAGCCIWIIWVLPQIYDVGSVIYYTHFTDGEVEFRQTWWLTQGEEVEPRELVTDWSLGKGRESKATCISRNNSRKCTKRMSFGKWNGYRVRLFWGEKRLACWWKWKWGTQERG